MNKLILFVCLLVAALTSSQYYLSPAYPPSAYQNQFYTTRFRIRGLDNPLFTFEGLPSSIKGTTDGVLSGIPNQAGSFSIIIKYKSGGEQGSNQVILKVLPNGKKTQNITQSVQLNNGLIVECSNNLIFVASQQIQISFVARNGKGNLVWVFNGLPTGLKGNPSKGIIEGSISDAGYYNFQVQCGDAEGNSAQIYLTINIQPKTTLKTTQIVEVPQQKLNNQLTYDLIEKEQVAADNQLFKALENVQTRKTIVADVKQHYAVATLRVQKAQASYDAADSQYRQAVNDQQIASNLVRNAQKTLNAAQKNLELALTEGTQAANAVAEQRKKVEIAQQRFNDAQKALQKAIQNVNLAKQKLQKCQEELRDAENKKKVAEQEYKRAVVALQTAKQVLEEAKTKKQKADQAVRAAQDAVQLATLARDGAESGLKEADFNLDKAEKQLISAIKKASDIRDKYNVAAEDENAAKWQLELAMNKLYIAQSRKEAADRSSAIALADGSYSDHNGGAGFSTIGSSGSSSISFGGCDSKNYPLITGTSQVQSVNTNGYRLASGQEVIYGSCSKTSNCQVGDFVSYNGYFVNGVVNALRIERILLS